MARKTDSPAGLQTRTNPAGQLNEIHERIERLRDDVLRSIGGAIGLAVEAGKILLEVKTKHKGEWLLWVETHCKFSHDTARNYIKLAENYAQIRNLDVDLQGLTSAYRAIGLLPERNETEGSGQDKNTDPFYSFWHQTKKLNEWVPKLPEAQKPRLIEWCLGLLKELGYSST